MTDVKIVPLPLEFKKNGYFYKQLKRTDKVAMYKGSTKEGDIHVYEVIVVRVVMNRKFKDIVYPPSEVLPGNGEFGRVGFCYGNFDGKGLIAAEKRYQDIDSGKFFDDKDPVEIDVADDSDDDSDETE